MLELIASDYTLVHKDFPTFRDALSEAIVMLKRSCLEHVWIRQKGNVLVLARVTPQTTYFSHLTSIPTAEL